MIGRIMGALLAVPMALMAQSPASIRVCTYDLLDYGEPTPERTTMLRAIVADIHPDLLVLHGIEGAAGALHFEANVAADRYLLAPFTDGPDSDNALFYDSSRISLVGHDTIATEPRLTDEWIVVVKGTGDTIHLLGADLKAGDTQEDREARLAAANLIRLRFASVWHHYLLAANLNVYESSEQAYYRITYIGGLSGELVDPIERPGNWHDNAEFAGIHTQSTRVRSFGGGITGGLDDRFDFILISPSLIDHVVPGSYTTFGNDGAHFNDSINRPPNNAVGSQMAQMLHDAGDHLPVYVDLRFDPPTLTAPEQERPGPMKIDLVDCDDLRDE